MLCSRLLGRSLGSLLISWTVFLLCSVGPWPCRAHGPVQHTSQVSFSSFRDPSVASKLGTQTFELLVRLRQASSVRLKQREEVLGLHAADTEKFQSTDELTLNSRSLADCFISGQASTDVLIWPSGEGEHLGHTGQTALFL